MIFTLRSNQARIERAKKAGYAKAVAEAEKRSKAAMAEAEERAKAAAAAAVEAAAELAAQQQAWESWNERRLAAEGEGRPFAEPPPGTTSGMNGNDGISGNGSGGGSSA